MWREVFSVILYSRCYSNNQFLTVLSLLYGSVQIEITEKASLRFWLRVVSYFSFGHGSTLQYLIRMISEKNIATIATIVVERI